MFNSWPHWVYWEAKNEEKCPQETKIHARSDTEKEVSKLQYSEMK